MLCEVWSLLTILSSWSVCMTSTCGIYWQPFCSKVTACDGTWPSSGAPDETYTTTLSNALLGPVTTVSTVTGVACCLAQVGSLDMSMGFCLAGVPVYVTLPLTVPANIRDEQTSSVKSASNICLVRIRVLPSWVLEFIYSPPPPGDLLSAGATGAGLLSTYGGITPCAADRTSVSLP